jgi:hypothetical protein
VLYLIDARTVLHSRDQGSNDEDTDWSCLGLFDENSTVSDGLQSARGHSDPGLDIVEIATVSCRYPVARCLS